MHEKWLLLKLILYKNNNLIFQMLSYFVLNYLIKLI